MQASRLARALGILNHELKLRELAELLTPIVEGKQNFALGERKSQFSSLVFTAQAAYRELSRDDELSEVMRVFGVTPLFEPNELAFLVTSMQNAGDASNIFGQPPQLTRFAALANVARSVVALGSGLDQLVVAGRRENVGQGQDVLELRVFGGQPDGLSPARLERILDNVENMHDAVVELTRDPAAKFGIAYLDSGSDFMVAFSSAKEVIGYLANCFAVVRRLRSLGIDAMRTESAFISQQLEVLKRLGEAVEAGTLTPERGNHIRQRLLTHLEAVCEAGVTLDGEAVEVLETDRRLIAAAQQRRLLGSGGAGNAESMGSAGDESKATDES